MLQPCVHFVLSNDVYERAAAVEAAKVFAAHVSCQIIRTAAEEMEIALYVPSAVPAGDSVIDEFLNYVLDLSIRQKIGRG